MIDLPRVKAPTEVLDRTIGSRRSDWRPEGLDVPTLPPSKPERTSFNAPTIISR